MQGKINIRSQNMHIGFSKLLTIILKKKLLTIILKKKTLDHQFLKKFVDHQFEQGALLILISCVAYTTKIRARPHHARSNRVALPFPGLSPPPSAMSSEPFLRLFPSRRDGNVPRSPAVCRVIAHHCHFRHQEASVPLLFRLSLSWRCQKAQQIRAVAVNSSSSLD
jgi:hypothetical protein